MSRFIGPSTQVTGRFSAGVQTIAYAASITPVADVLGNLIDVGTLTGNITVNAPTGTPLDSQLMTFRFTLDSTGGRTVTWNAIYQFGSDILAASLPTDANASFEVAFRYHSATSKWRAVGFVKIAGGFSFKDMKTIRNLALLR